MRAEGALPCRLSSVSCFGCGSPGTRYAVVYDHQDRLLPPLPPWLESDHELLERVEHADDALVSGVAEWARAAPTAAR